jgi:hypothetical protein
LTLTTSGVSSIDYSGSSLRYGLLDIKPIEVVETIKKCGMKFLRITRKFESLKAPETYSDLVTFQNQAIIDSIKLPNWFDSNELIKELSRFSIESYEKDEEFKKAVEELKKADRIGRPLLSFVQFVKNRLESKRDLYLDLEADRFLRSNFPLSVYNRFVVFDNTYQEFLKILEDKVRRYEFLANYSRNFEMYKKRISEMRVALSPIIDQVDACFLHYSRLKKYMVVWNAKDYSELRNPKFLDIGNVDYAEFEKVFAEYCNKLMETRQLLLRLDEDILRRNFDLTEYATRKVFSRLATLPSSSLTLKS